MAGLDEGRPPTLFVLVGCHSALPVRTSSLAGSKTTVTMGRTFPTGVAAPILLENLRMIGRVQPSVDLAHPQSSIAPPYRLGTTDGHRARGHTHCEPHPLSGEVCLAG